MTAKKSQRQPGEGGFEQSIKRLEEIVDALENGGVTLDQVMTMYEEGVKLSRQCLDQLADAELKLKRLTKDIEGKFGLIDESEIDS